MNMSVLSMCSRRQMLLAGFLVSLPSLALAAPVDDLAVVDRYIAAWNAHDPDAAIATLASDAVYFNSAVGEDQTAQDAIGNVLRGLLGVLPDLKWQKIGQPIAAPASVAVEWEVSGSFKPEGRAQATPLHIRGVSVFRLGGGRITYLADYYDSETMRRQLQPFRN